MIIPRTFILPKVSQLKTTSHLQWWPDWVTEPIHIEIMAWSITALSQFMNKSHWNTSGYWGHIVYQAVYQAGPVKIHPRCLIRPLGWKGMSVRVNFFCVIQSIQTHVFPLSCSRRKAICGTSQTTGNNEFQCAACYGFLSERTLLI